MSEFQIQIARDILDAAINSPEGIEVLVESPQPMAGITLRAKQILYSVRKENADYKVLQIRLSPTDPSNSLWIIKTADLGTDPNMVDLDIPFELETRTKAEAGS